MTQESTPDEKKGENSIEKPVRPRCAGAQKADILQSHIVEDE